MTDDMIIREGILHPQRERVHVFVAMVLFVAMAITAHLTYLEWSADGERLYLYLAAAIIIGVWYGGISWAYRKKRRKNELSPAISGR